MGEGYASLAHYVKWETKIDPQERVTNFAEDLANYFQKDRRLPRAAVLDTLNNSTNH
jgi:hypothetical protein